LSVVIWSDIDDKFVQDGHGGLKKVENVWSVVVSVRNILGTYMGERVMLPTFASPLHSMVFEPIDSGLMFFIADQVKNVIEVWDDRVQVVTVDFYESADQNAIELSVSFRIRGYEEIFSYSQTLSSVIVE